jgi:hypothetical protein
MKRKGGKVMKSNEPIVRIAKRLLDSEVDPDSDVATLARVYIRLRETVISLADDKLLDVIAALEWADRRWIGETSQSLRDRLIAIGYA